MELKRNSRCKFVLYLEKLSTVIHKFKFKIVTLAALILGFWGKRLVHVFWSWGFWFHTAMRTSCRWFLCLRVGKTISNSKLSPCLLQWAPSQSCSYLRGIHYLLHFIWKTAWWKNYSLPVATFYALRAGGIKMNAKKYNRLAPSRL